MDSFSNALTNTFDNTCLATNLANITTTATTIANLAISYATNNTNTTAFDTLDTVDASIRSKKRDIVFLIIVISWITLILYGGGDCPDSKMVAFSVNGPTWSQAADQQPRNNAPAYQPRSRPELSINTALASSISHRPVAGPAQPATHLVPALIRSVVDTLAQIFKDIPFVVSGRTALSIYGYHGIQVPHVTMLCTQANLRSVKNWVRARGLPRLSDNPFSFTIATPAGAALVRVRGTTESLSKVYVGEYGCPLITLPTLADRLAKAYVGAIREDADMVKQAAYMVDISWVLTQISRSERGMQWFSNVQPPTWLFQMAFWEPFLASFPGMKNLFESAGLDLRRAWVFHPRPLVIPGDQHGSNVSLNITGLIDNCQRAVDEERNAAARNAAQRGQTAAPNGMPAVAGNAAMRNAARRQQGPPPTGRIRNALLLSVSTFHRSILGNPDEDQNQDQTRN